MIKFFSSNKSIFYSINLFLIFFYLFPGNLLGLIIYNDLNIEPKITRNFIISSNHFYMFLFISIIGFFTYKKNKKEKDLTVYLIFLSIILEVLHLFIPERSYQWSDLFGNLLGVIVVFLINNLINKYEYFKK